MASGTSATNLPGVIWAFVTQKASAACQLQLGAASFAQQGNHLEGLVRKLETKIILAAVLLGVLSLPSAAHERGLRVYRPYYIEKSCDEDLLRCSARMVYAPGQNPGLAGHGSYWYPRATRYVRVVNEDHVNWCLRRYKTYDPDTDTFVGKGYHHYRCNSPYDGI